MNIVIAHGFAHRLLESGTVESAFVLADGNGFHVNVGDWKQRTAESMDLTGGDEELIRNTLDQMRHVFPDNLDRLPHSENEFELQIDASKPV